MHKKFSFNATELRGLAQLATTATINTSHIVESLHHTIAKPWLLLSKTAERKMGGVPGLVYSTVRGTARLAGGGAALALRALPGKLQSREESSAFVSALNGVLGDHLAATANPLAIRMGLHLGAGFTRSGSALVVLVHGLCMNDAQWACDGHDHGVGLAKTLGATPLYVRYNTGLSIAENGALLSAQLQSLVQAWPEKVKSVTIVAHSMGGLVTRAACAHADSAHQEWRRVLKNIVFLGTPHTGAPLERGGHWIEMLLAAIPYSAPFVRLTTLRSAGILDLRFGNTADPLPKDVRCFAIAGALGNTPKSLAACTLGDGLVAIESALGTPELQIPARRVWIAQGVGHLELLSSKDVFKKMLTWLRQK